MSLDWVIIGGGVHGVHLAARLSEDGGADRGRMRIVDPGERLLERWWSRVDVLGMSYLRSTSVHHLDTHFASLRRFARGQRKSRSGLYAHPYDRPAVELFREHCAHVLDRLGLCALQLRDEVVSCDASAEGLAVRCASGTRLDARRVVLALGPSPVLVWPSWAPRSDARVQHVFDAAFDGWSTVSPSNVAVVGGGISAAQVALRLVREGHRVDLVSRHPLRKSDFDADPGWLGPKFMAAFEDVADLRERRALIRAARQNGSIPPDVLLPLRGALSRGQVRFRQTSLVALNGAGPSLELSFADGSAAAVDRLLLATGFSDARPGGALVDRMVREGPRPCAPCGYPVLDKSLRWGPGLYVRGHAAALTSGGPRQWAVEVDTPDGRPDRGMLRALAVAGPHASAWISFVASVVELFARLVGARSVGVRQVVADGPQCPRFHVDQVGARGVLTVLGACTEWLDEEAVDRNRLGHSGGADDSTSGLVRDWDRLRRLDPGELAIFKGTAWPGAGERAAVHRSPPADGRTRLLLTLDCLAQ